MLQRESSRSNDPIRMEWMQQQEHEVAVYLAKVMGWMCVGLLTTLAVGLFFLAVPQALYALYSSKLMYVTLFAQLGVVIGMSAAINKLSPTAATVLFMVYAALTGVTFTSLFLIFDTFSLIYVFGICAMVFMLMAVYGFTAKRDLTRIGRLAFFGLIGIILAGIINFFVASSPLDMLISIVGIVVFIVLIAYDTQHIKMMYYGTAERGMGDSPMAHKLAIYGALMLYLDFINLFIKLLYLLGNRRGE